ncbi:MAG: RIP metalloprotease RseP [Proteobacteria bacterium]|nr:RIP metalloprotease RseP [Pseudomonadota bacterium]
MVSVISAIIVLGVLILVHEFGHYVVARFINVKVLKFSLGFGPKIFGIKGKETEYLISAVPLGGYVKLYGEESEDEVLEEPERAFSNQTPLKKIAIVISGPLFNFFFAIILFILFNIFGFQTLSNVVGDVKEGYPAYVAGLQKNDRIVKINEKNVKTWEEISSIIKASGGKTLEVVFERDGKIYYTKINPKIEKIKNIFGEEVEMPVLGIVSSDKLIKVSYPIHEAIIRGIKQFYELTKLTLITVQKLINRTVPVSSLGGPIMISQLAGETAKSGIYTFLAFMALLSVNLGVLNLLPIPILDGGHIVLFIIEAITRKPVSNRFKEAYTYIGMMIIILLTVTVFYNDIMRIFAKK